MSRYIDADALIEELERCSYLTWSKDINRAWWAQAVQVKNNIVRCIKQQPAADVVDTEIAEGYRKMFEDCAEDRAKLTDENERLRADAIVFENASEIALNNQKQDRADTVREFAERLHKRFGSDSNLVYSNYNIHRYIDQTAKEMMEG